MNIFILLSFAFRNLSPFGTQYTVWGDTASTLNSFGFNVSYFLVIFIVAWTDMENAYDLRRNDVTRAVVPRGSAPRQ